MLFKTLQTVILLQVVLFSFGCDFLSSQTPDSNQSKRITLEVSQLSCLQDVSQDVFRFFEDTLSQQEFEQTFQCIDSSIQKFLSVTKPSKNGRYNYKELQHFLNRYLIETNKISDSFMFEIMKVKAFVLGGEAQHLTSDEIAKGRQYLVKVRSELTKVLGSMRKITFQEGIDLSHQSFDLTLILKDVVASLTSDAAFNGDYSTEDSIQFFKELSLFAGHSELFKNIESFSVLALNLKSLLIGSGNNTQNKSQWIKAVEWSAEVYSLCLQAVSLYHNFDGESVTVWIKTVTVFDQIMLTLKNSPQFIHHRKWHTFYLDRVVEELKKTKLLSSPITSEVWINSYKMAVIRFLDRDRGLQKNSKDLTFIDESHLNIFDGEWQMWKSNQTWILQQTSFLRSDLKKEAQKQLIRTSRLFLSNHWLDSIVNDRFYNLISYQDIQFSHSAVDQAVLSVSGLTLSNTINSLARFMLLGYGHGRSRNFWENTITKDDLLNWELDFSDLLKGLRIIDIRSEDRPSRFIQEANLFTLSGNGDHSIDGRELSELITVMIVSGRFITDQFFEQLLVDSTSRGCPGVGQDDTGKIKFLRSCVFDSFRRFFPRILAQLGGLNREWESLAKEDQFLFLERLLELGKLPDEQAWMTMEYVEYRSSIVFLYYLETLFSIYDLNQDGVLNYAEVLRSYPRFKNFIQERVYARFQGKVPDKAASFIRNWESLTEEVFLYAIYYGKEPSMAELGTFQVQKLIGLPEVNRLHMLGVFGYLKGAETQQLESLINSPKIE